MAKLLLIVASFIFQRNSLAISSTRLPVHRRCQHEKIAILEICGAAPIYPANTTTAKDQGNFYLLQNI